MSVIKGGGHTQGKTTMTSEMTTAARLLHNEGQQNGTEAAQDYLSKCPGTEDRKNYRDELVCELEHQRKQLVKGEARLAEVKAALALAEAIPAGRNMNFHYDAVKTWEGHILRAANRVDYWRGAIAVVDAEAN